MSSFFKLIHFNLRRCVAKMSEKWLHFCFWLRCGTRETFRWIRFGFCHFSRSRFSDISSVIRHLKSPLEGEKEIKKERSQHHISLHFFSSREYFFLSHQRNPIKSIENQVFFLLLYASRFFFVTSKFLIHWSFEFIIYSRKQLNRKRFCVIFSDFFSILRNKSSNVIENGFSLKMGRFIATVNCHLPLQSNQSLDCF